MSNESGPPPPISHVLETVLYVRSLSKSVQFYKDVIGLKPLMETPRIAGFPLTNSMLLLFQLGATAADSAASGASVGTIPGHGPTEDVLERLLAGRHSDGAVGGQSNTESGELKQHFCFAVEQPSDVIEWEVWLREKGVKITGTMDWERGGKSVYFADPDGHVGEVASRGLWPHY